VDFVPLSKEITAVGYVEFNERGQKTVPARVAGRLDVLHVSETGRLVDEDDPLAEMYSPELVVTVTNLLDARRRGNEAFLQDARTRLARFGIDDKQIDDILATGETTIHLTIRSPIKGHVIQKYVREGQYVEVGSPLYDLADLSTVWIEAQIYEEDMAFLPLGHTETGAVPEDRRLRVTATTGAFPGAEFEGRLSFIYPHVDQETRTVTVRFEHDNPGHKLRPGSTATVSLKVPPKDVPVLVESTSVSPEARELLEQGRVLAVPEGAIIDTGNQRIVYRETSNGVYEGLKVELGPKMTGEGNVVYYPVLAGLKPGDKVVTAGSFLVDAETRLNPAAGSIYFGGSGGAQTAQSDRTIRPSTPVDVDATVATGLAQLAAADRSEAEAQRYCPILEESRLGSMGRPVKLRLEGVTVFVCCEACRKKAVANPSKTLAKVERLKERTAVPSDEPDRDASHAARGDDDEAEVTAALAELSTEDRAVAEAQRFCAVLEDSRLGSMGVPVRLEIDGLPVFVCCEGCRERALADPAATLATVESLKATNDASNEDESNQAQPGTD
jgi:RND family efflux transporter MFP subunit